MRRPRGLADPAAPTSPSRLLRSLVLVGHAGALLAGCSRGDGAPGGGAAPVPTTAPATTTTTGAVASPAACTPPRPAPPGARDATLAFGGIDRRYRVHVPPAHDGSTPLPVVFDFHGHGSSAGVQLAYSGIVPIADREGFVVVAPEGQGRPSHFTLLGPTPTEADDVALTVAVLDRVAAELCVDPDRVYATGMSNGGALSSVLACRAGDRFAAVAAVAAVIAVPACERAPRVAPILAMMGTADPVVPFGGGRVNCCGNPDIPATATTIASFARRAGCDPEPVVEQVTAMTERRRYDGCDPGAAVELYVVVGGGHTWPGSGFEAVTRALGPTDPELHATEVQWSFFRRHRRQAP